MKRCQVVLDPGPGFPSGKGFFILVEYNPAICCGKPAVAATDGGLPVCADHYDGIEALKSR